MDRTLNRYRPATALLAAMLLVGCQSAPPREPAAPFPAEPQTLASGDSCPMLEGERHEAPVLRPSDRFIAFTDEPRVRFEPGGERLASRVAGHLDTAIARVEAEHGLPFANAVTVHVFANPRSFGIESPTPDAIGLTVGDRLFLSPRLADSPQRIEGILTHELAHLHFIQHLGADRAYETLPRWFAEGFAVVVSGSGADRVPEAEAVTAIVAGEHLELLPANHALLKTQQGPGGISPQMFYRQSTMFVEFLRAHYGETAFRQLLSRLFGGERFEEAFLSSFGHPVPTAWTEFVASIHPVKGHSWAQPSP